MAPKAQKEAIKSTGFKSKLLAGDYNLYVVILFGAFMFLPFLGSVGLWDPWETHYGEVAREMMVRGDYVKPYWESGYFFSKPVLIFWLEAASMHVLGVNEWGIRLPTALLAILQLILLYVAISRLINRRVGLFASFILATSPQFFFLAKQAVTDMPFVSLMTSGMLCFLVAFFEDEKKDRPGWLYAGYAFLALATLAKGLLGFAVPGAIFLLYMLLSGDWAILRRARLISGSIIFLIIASPWYVYMSLFDGRDTEGKTFFQRFWIHDHFNRIGGGVHGSRGNFVFFIEQLGFGMFPWSAILPLALIDSFKLKITGLTRESKTMLIFILWAVGAFALFQLSVTKFHHYIFPALPALSVIIAYYVDRFIDDKTDSSMLVYFAAFIAYIILARDIALSSKVLVDLFIYNYERIYPVTADIRWVYPVMFTAAGALMVYFYFFGNAKKVMMTLFALAFAFSVYGVHVYFNQMSPHWSQKYMFDTYYSQRQSGEPIGAYLMNWRGETYYSKNTVRQLKSQGELNSFLTQSPGRKWLLVETGRYSGMKSSMPQDYSIVTRIVDRSCNKFYLVLVDEVKQKLTPSLPGKKEEEGKFEGGAPE
ncbi:MAG: glycosyltransferase family 39 protein [Myxococcota bacterium]